MSTPPIALKPFKIYPISPKSEKPKSKISLYSYPFPLIDSSDNNSLPSILGPRPSLLGPRPSVLGPRPSLLGPYLSSQPIAQPPQSRRTYIRSFPFPVVAPDFVVKDLRSTKWVDTNLIYSFDRKRKYQDDDPSDMKMSLKKLKKSSAVCDIMDEGVDVQVLDKVYNRTLAKPLRKRKRVWNDGLVTSLKLLQIKKGKLQWTSNEDFNQIELHLQNLHESNFIHTPQSIKFANSIDNFACVLCVSKACNNLLVVFSNPSRSNIDIFKNFGLFRDTDHEENPLVCSCHKRLPNWFPFVLLYHSMFAKDLDHKGAQAKIVYELLLYISTLRRTWVFRKALAIDDSKIICYIMFHLFYVMFYVFFGDVHDEWLLEEDAKALQFLKPDLVLFTGDFGNENVELVRTIADLQMRKAVILGNHDAWRTKRFSEREKDAVQLQLECLGDEHVGFRRLDFPTLKLSVVGGRPFSCGGKDLYRERLLKARYGISNMDESSKRIYHAAQGTPDNHSVIFLAHNGPSGLGSNMNDICGRDWIHGGGDHGDPDLENAISQLKETTSLSIPLVVFGHMHKGLAYGGLRKMIAIRDDGTTYLNGAILPRVWQLGSNQEPCNSSSTYNGAEVKSHGSCRVFTIAELFDGELAKVTETWVSVIGDTVALAEEYILFPPIC